MHTPQKYEFAMLRINNDRYCSDLREQVFNFDGKNLSRKIQQIAAVLSSLHTKLPSAYQVDEYYTEEE